jgi:hypothetical protein
MNQPTADRDRIEPDPFLEAAPRYAGIDLLPVLATERRGTRA